MSPSNVELARRGVEALLAGDWETTAELIDPWIEWEETPGLGPDASTFRAGKIIRNRLSGSWDEARKAGGLGMTNP